MKLKTHASAMGSRTSRAKYKVATMITVINMALSVEDDELTADPPTDVVGYRAQGLQNRNRGSLGAGLCRLYVYVGSVRSVVYVKSPAPQTPRLRSTLYPDADRIA